MSEIALDVPSSVAAAPGSATTEIPSTPAAGSVAVAERPFMESLPAEYRESGWAKELAKNEKPWEALAKSHANALEVVGKKSAGVEIPGEDATPEQIANFNKAMGVPEKPDGYEYKAPDISKEPEAVQNALKARAADTSFIDAMRVKAHEAGITPKQFSLLAAAFDAQTIQQVKASLDGQSTAQAAYLESETKIFKEMYGDKGESVKATAKEILAKVVPQNIRESKNPNLALVAMAMYVHEKVFKNDTIGGANQGAPQLSKEAIRAKITELRAKPGYKDWSMKDHKDLNAQVDALYNQMFEKAPE